MLQLVQGQKLAHKEKELNWKFWYIMNQFVTPLLWFKRNNEGSRVWVFSSFVCVLALEKKVKNSFPFFSFFDVLLDGNCRTFFIATKCCVCLSDQTTNQPSNRPTIRLKNRQVHTEVSLPIYRKEKGSFSIIIIISFFFSFSFFWRPPVWYDVCRVSYPTARKAIILTTQLLWKQHCPKHCLSIHVSITYSYMLQTIYLSVHMSV